MKKFYESKTFWFNALYLLVAVASYLGFGEFSASPDVVELAAVVVAVINIVLRYATKEPISL